MDGQTDGRTDGQTDGNRKICPMWNHRSSAPPGPLPKKGLVGQFFIKPPNRPKIVLIEIFLKIDEISNFFDQTSSQRFVET